MTRRALAGAVPGLLVLGLLLAPASGAVAGSAAGAPPSGTTCTQEQAARGECTIVAEDEREEGGGQGGGNGGPAVPRVCTWQGSEVPCASDDGPWNQALQCYVGGVVPEPASGTYTPEPSPAEVEQRTADGQQAYACYPPDWTIPMRIPIVWLDGAPPVDPRVVAERAIANLQVEAVDIGMAPSTLSDDPDSLGLVGLPVHMWAQDAGASTVGPTSASATAGSVTVTATARLDRVVWSMGDGTSVTCTGPGTPYDPARGAAPSPDCGHEYTTTSAGQPSDAFTVTATSYWVVDWAGGGQSGQVTFELSSSDQVRIGESQVVVTRGG